MDTNASNNSIVNTFGIFDYGVFGIFLLSSALIGLWFGWKGRKSADNKEFLTGNRNLAMFPVVMSLAASFMSTNTTLGVPAEVYTLGAQFAVSIVPFTIAVILSAEVFMPVFYDLNMTSVNEYLFVRFKSKHVRTIGSLGFLFCTLPYMAVVLYGPSLALSSVTPLSVERSVLVVGAICTFYTSIGGIKAVIWTDVLQCLLMILGLMMIIFYGVFQGNSLLEPFKIAQAHGRLNIFQMSPNPYRNDTFWTCFFGSLVGWCGSYCISQTEVQRFCSTKSAKHARRTLYWNIPPVILIALLAIWCGIILFARYYQCDPLSMGILERADQLMPYFVMETMAHLPGVAGLFTACVFSGALSTLSSGFNSLAAVTWEDFLKDHFVGLTGHQIKRLTKFIAAGYGIVSLGLAFIVGQLGTVLQASAALSGSVRGPLLSLYILAFFFPFINTKGAIAGVISGVSMSLFMAFGTLFSKRPQAHLDLFTNNCSDSIYATYGHRPPKEHIYPWEYEPEGINHILHISYFYINVVGFLVTLITGIAVSMATGSNNADDVDVSLLSKWHLPLSPSFPAFGNKRTHKQVTLAHNSRHDNSPGRPDVLNSSAEETIPLR